MIEPTKKKKSKLGLVSLPADGDTLKSFDQSLKTRDDRLMPYLGCHKMLEMPIKTGILLQGNASVFHGKCNLVLLFFSSVIYFKTLSLVTHKRTMSRIFGEINR